MNKDELIKFEEDAKFTISALSDIVNNFGDRWKDFIEANRYNSELIKQVLALSKELDDKCKFCKNFF